MVKNSMQNQNEIAQRVKISLRKAERVSADLRQKNKRFLVVGISSSAGATLVAGITAVVGPVIGQGDLGWRTACLLAAVFGFVSTVSTGLNQQLRINDRLANVRQCVGKLRSLDLIIESGSRDREEIVEEYAEIATAYPEFIG